MNWKNPINGQNNPKDWDLGWISYRLSKFPKDTIYNVLFLVKSLKNGSRDIAIKPFTLLKKIANGPLRMSDMLSQFYDESEDQDLYMIDKIKISKKDKKNNTDSAVVKNSTDEESFLKDQALIAEKLESERDDEVTQLEKQILELETIEIDVDENPESTQIADNIDESDIHVTLESDVTSDLTVVNNLQLPDSINQSSDKIQGEKTEEIKENSVADPAVGIPMSDNLSPFTQFLNAMNPSSSSTDQNLLFKANKSISDKNEIISEPLAKILASQGHISESIEMYNKLGLKFPEKSGYFANLIEALKNQR